VLTDLGFASDPRLGPAVKILIQKRRADGTWWIDRSHPDIGAGTTIHPDPSQLKPLVVEKPGRPSKWVTMKALRVLKRVEDAS
jgi:hypothetical protein